MSRRLFWQLSVSLLAVSLLIFSSLHHLSDKLTVQLTEITPDNQSVLRQLAVRAEKDMAVGDREDLLALALEVKAQYGTWAAVVLSDNTIISSSPIPKHLRVKLGFQRHVYWPVHEFMTDVLVGIPFSDNSASFVIELPREMFPKTNTELIHNLLTIIIPSFLMMLFCLLAYRYLMKPLDALHKGALKLAEGDLSARVLPDIPDNRRDELTQVASSFDSMASRIERLVNSQRQLLGDLSHELRTPLTRLELALDICREEKGCADDLLPRLEREIGQMHHLVEDALMLAWLDGDPTMELKDHFNLATLLELIIEDAEFEYPSSKIARDFDTQLPVSGSSQQALSQAIENILRNALKYSPQGAPVEVACFSVDDYYQIVISDSGPGVDACQLQKIFEPFYRTDKARSREVGGFGLGLALCQRQINAVGGKIFAENGKRGGLQVSIMLPQQSAL